jgi:predicted PurR-regulated permease PerM
MPIVRRRAISTIVFLSIFASAFLLLGAYQGNAQTAEELQQKINAQNDKIKQLELEIAANQRELDATSKQADSLKNSINIQEISDSISSFTESLNLGAFNTVVSVFGGFLSFILMVVLSFYLSVDENGVAKFLRIVTPLKHEKYILNLWQRAQHKIGLWMQGQLVLAVIIGMLVFLGLTLLGVKNALLLSFLAAVFEIIPLFGPILASIPAVVLSFVSGGISTSVLVIGLYVIIHQFENHLIYPLVVKKVIGVSPIVSIVALVAGWELFGFLGMVLSVPVATAFMEFLDDLEKDKIEKIERMNS